VYKIKENLEAVKGKIEALLELKFREEEFQDCFIVDITIGKNNKVQVFVDCEHGVSLATCSQLSRHLESWLDESLVLGEKYTLEVSSPGLERPLIKRQYPKNTGRQIRVKTVEGAVITGLLEKVTDENISVRVEQKKESALVEISFEQIEESKIIVSF
jgi:ribosome maturation factor RimP